MKKFKLLLTTVFILILLIVFGNTIYAEGEEPNTMDLNIIDERPYSNPKRTYTVQTPNGNVHTIFKIGKRITPESEELNFEDALYCFRSGLGFGNSASVIDVEDVEDVLYTERYNLKTQSNDVLQYFHENIYTMDEDTYNSLLWIIDNMYLPEHADAEEMKAKLLRKADIVMANTDELTDDDIEFVQQMALWYFTNFDENGGENSLSLKLNNEEGQPNSIMARTKINEESLREDTPEARAMETLYRYFIESAIENRDLYKDKKEIDHIKPTINIDTTRKDICEEDNFTVIGPFNITATNGNVDYTVSFAVKDKNGETIPEKQETTPIVYVVENTTDMVQCADSIQEMIGQGDFYLKISNLWKAGYNLEDVNIEANIEYEKIYKTTATLWLATPEDQPVVKIEKEEVKEGKFNIDIHKVDEEGNLIIAQGTDFKIIKIGEEGQRTGIILDGSVAGIFRTSDLEIKANGEEFIFEISEENAPLGFRKLTEPFRIKVITELRDGKYVIKEVLFVDADNQEIDKPDEVDIAINKETGSITLKVKNEKIKVFDLALRKYITKINGDELVNTKVPNINLDQLKVDTTAEYKHRKDAVEVKTGDEVEYTISVYNEGDVDGIVNTIIDYLPEGLTFNPELNSDFIEYKESYEGTELEGKKYIYSFDEDQRKLTITPVEGTTLFELIAFDGENLDSKSIQIICEVTAEKTYNDQILTNIATMKYAPKDEKYADLLDVDSHPLDSAEDQFNLPDNWADYKGNDDNKEYLGDSEYFYKGQEDDDDFDKVIIRGVPFDLALRKFITKVNGKEITTRIPEFDTSKLNEIDTTSGNRITTATYTHSKEPVVVKQGDIVQFTLRVYNEGELNGYAKKIIDYIPEGLGYLMDYKNNTDNYWTGISDETTDIMDLVGEKGLYNSEEAVKNLELEDFNGKTSLSEIKILTGNSAIYTTALEEELIKAYNPETTSEDIEEDDKWQKSTNGEDGLYYRDVELTCIVLEENTFNGTIRNIAEIMESQAVDAEGTPMEVSDRDSSGKNVNKEAYNPPEDNSTYQEDDDDYEPLELRYFDLALRKFITAVNDDAVTTRIPKPTLNKEGNIEYVHDKTPVYVANSDIVTYTIRVYNEGTILGYAMEVSDDIPDGLVFLPEHDTNKEYGWKMYDEDGEETDDPLKAVEIRTEYLNNTLLNTYDATKEISEEEPFNPDCADVKVAFQVLEDNITQEDRIILNKAQITKDKAVDVEGNEIDIDDNDSIPNEWNEGEDDQDIEKVYVKYFDLALLKWVTKSIVTVDGKTTTTETGFTPYDDPEPIAKVVIDKKKLNKTEVKFAYNIIITNQGEIEGYATEITDYIPEGLEFNAEDNPIWYKRDDGRIGTRALENTLLKPGDTATVEVIFRWKKDEKNLGLKTNIAEISEDYNEKGSKDIDSEPDNVKIKDYDKQQEDDDDKALVMLELKTGGVKASYLWLGLTVLLILSGGVLLIKKFVI